MVEILGSYLQTTKKNATGYPKHKVDAALLDCKMIGRLPIALASKEHLVSTKVVPRIACTPGMTRMPIAILEKIQSSSADTIWKDRPVWRSRSLLFAVLGKLHRSDPICARAYITILDTINFLLRHPAARRTWEVIFEQDAHLESSLRVQFAQACAMFNIEWRGPFYLALWEEISFSFLTLSKADIKRVLQMLAAHKMYSVAMRSKRKDVSPAVGFFDKQATTSSFNWLQLKFPDRFRVQHLQSMLVGCAPTADRTFAAGTALSSDCRFCRCAKEDLHHLAFNCPSLPLSLERPDDDPQFGPNFSSMGLVWLKFRGGPSLTAFRFPLRPISWLNHGTLHRGEQPIIGRMAQ